MAHLALLSFGVWSVVYTKGCEGMVELSVVVAGRSDSHRLVALLRCRRMEYGAAVMHYFVVLRKMRGHGQLGRWRWKRTEPRSLVITGMRVDS